MPVKKPVRHEHDVESSQTLMGHQDTSKGDVIAKKKNKCITFWVTEEQKMDYRRFAAEHYMTLSRLIVEGIELRMRQG